MILFRWFSQALRNYGPGHIVVMAATVDEAREKARESYIEYLKDYWELSDEQVRNPPDWLDDIPEKLALFDDDLKVEPEIRRMATILIPGSD